WNITVAPATTAKPAVSTPGAAAFTGVTVGNNGTANFLYAADFQNGKIDVFSATFAPTTLAGSFDDPAVPDRFAPLHIQNAGNELSVTYARKGRNGDPSAGGGFVSVFDLNGNFLRRIEGHGRLNEPWGLALAPAGFGDLGGALLVGNHGDGRISAFDP